MLRGTVLFLLAGGAPKKIAPLHDALSNRGAAHITGLAGAAININFATMIVFTWLAAHGLRGVLVADSVDTPALHTDGHQPDKVCPNGIEFIAF